jgi:hypothetical protein
MDLQIEKSDIEKIRKIRKEDKFFNHFLTNIKHDYSFYGEIRKIEIKIWSFNLWNAIFYPIFIFKFNSNNKLISISSKLNSFGKLIYVLFLIFLTSFFKNINFAKATILGLLLFIVFYLVFISIFILISFKIYGNVRKNQLEMIYEKIKRNKKISKQQILKQVQHI